MISYVNCVYVSTVDPSWVLSIFSKWTCMSLFTSWVFSWSFFSMSSFVHCLSFLSMSCFLLLSVFTMSNLDLHSWLHVQSFPSFLVFQKHSIPSFHCCSRLHIRFLCRLRYIWHPSLQIFHFHSNSIVILYQFSPSPLLVIGTGWSSTLWRVNFFVSKFTYSLAYRFFGSFLPCENLFKLEGNLVFDLFRPCFHSIAHIFFIF